jgi:hypothetical protein
VIVLNDDDNADGYYKNPTYEYKLKRESDSDYNDYSDYDDSVQIDKWETYSITLKVTADIDNGTYARLTVTDEITSEFTWKDVPAVEITAASYNSVTQESTLTFNVDRKGADVNGLFMVVIPSETTTDANRNRIVGTRLPPNEGDVLTAFNQVQGNNLKYVVPYNLFPTNSSNLADVDAVICAGNEEGFGYDQNGLV